MTHDSQKLVMWCCFEERHGGTSTALPVEDLLAQRECQCRFVLVGIFLLLLVPPVESFSLHLSRSLLMVFDGLGGVLNKRCSPL